MKAENEQSISINIKVAHLEYLRDEFGVSGFIKKYRQKKAISFLRWVSSELKAIDKLDKADNLERNEGDVRLVKLPEAHYDIGAYALSILSYKEICETFGAAIPSDYINTMNELKEALRKFEEAAEEEEKNSKNGVSHLSQDEFRKKLTTEVRNLYDQVLKFGNEYPDFPVDVPNINPKLSYNFTRGQSTSWAKGTQQVSLALDPFVQDQKTGRYFYWEYASIRRSRSIGEFTTHRWDLPVMALICHELAHSFQRAIEKAAKSSRPEVAAKMSRSHGKGWQEVYKIFRDKFVNQEVFPEDFIDEQ